MANGPSPEQNATAFGFMQLIVMAAENLAMDGLAPPRSIAAAISWALLEVLENAPEDERMALRKMCSNLILIRDVNKDEQDPAVYAVRLNG